MKGVPFSITRFLLAALLFTSACSLSPAAVPPTGETKPSPGSSSLPAHPGLSPTPAQVAPALPEVPEPQPTQTLRPIAVLPTPTLPAADPAPSTLYSYPVQSGDSLPALAVRFGVPDDVIQAVEPLTSTGLIPPGTVLHIPRVLTETTSSAWILPNSEVIFSPSVAGFDVQAFAREAGGYLGGDCRDYLMTNGWLTGPQIVERIALENSIHPRLLLALLEYESGWVRGEADPATLIYPLGHEHYLARGLYRQLLWAAEVLSTGYYGWREGTLTELIFPDGARLRLAPELNAGTVALMVYFSQERSLEAWQSALDPETGFPALYLHMYPGTWEQAEGVGHLYPPGLSQPTLQLPFEPGVKWSLTSGPHTAWQTEGARAALDFAPPALGCRVSPEKVLAAAPGRVTRSEPGLVALDLDGDGFEGTGWVLVYVHLADLERAPLGAWLETDDLVGHASCDGGPASGTHVHLVRKYNGEWVAAGGPLPFVLGGWTAHNGELPFHGSLTRGDQVVLSNQNGAALAHILREETQP